MPTVRQRQNDFTAGEWSGRLQGRVDLDHYPRSARRLENFLLLAHGAAQRKPGTHWVAQAQGTGLARLIRFEFSATDAYLLEFTAGHIRFYRQNGRVETSPGVAYDLATTYAESELRLLKYAQSNDQLFLTHEAHPPAVLSRLGLTNWRLRDVVFDVPPSREFGHRTTATLTPSATSGVGITLTASAAMFEASDVGRYVTVSGGANLGARCLITAYTSQTVVTATVVEVFVDTTATPAGSWYLETSPKTTLTPGAKDPVGASITLTLAAAGWRNPGASSPEIGKFVKLNGGTVEITAVSSATVAAGTIRAVLNATTGAPSGAWTLEEPAFSPLNGYPRTNTFGDGRWWLGGTPAEVQAVWGSKSGDFFNFATGELADDAIAFTLDTDQQNSIRWLTYNGALIIGTAGGEFVVDPGEGQVLKPDNLPIKPQTRYGSAAAVSPLQVASVTLFPSRSQRKVREFTFSFDVNKYVAPDLLLLAEHMSRRTRLNGARLRRQIVDLAYQAEPSGIVWAVRDDGTLLGMTYLREQNVVGWHRHVSGTAVMEADGFLHPAPGDGQVESVAVIPHPDGDRDQVWLSVQRTIGGVVRHYIEYLDDEGVSYDYLNVDAGLTYDGTSTVASLTPSAVGGAGVTFTASAPFFAAGDVFKQIRVPGQRARATVTAYLSATQVTGTVAAGYEFPSLSPIAAGAWGLAAYTFSGLGHLEGKTVDICGDGAAYPQAVVTGGSVTLSYAAIKVEIGLPYVSTVITQRPELPQLGTAQGFKQRFAKIIVRLYETLGLTVNGKPVPFRTSADEMGAPPQLFTGDKMLENLGDGSDAAITLQQTQPLPMTILLVAGVLNAEDP